MLIIYNIITGFFFRLHGCCIYDYFEVILSYFEVILVFWDFLRFNEYNNIPINAAKGLYCALITDTGSFKYNSTTPECHHMAAHLLSLGVKPYDIYSEVYERREIPQIVLLSLAINKIKFFLLPI